MYYKYIHPILYTQIPCLQEPKNSEYRRGFACGCADAMCISSSGIHEGMDKAAEAFTDSPSIEAMIPIYMLYVEIVRIQVIT